MEKKILRYTINHLSALVLVAFLLQVNPCRAQQQYGNTMPQGNAVTKKQKDKKALGPNDMKYPKMGGFSLGVDIAGLGGGLFGGNAIGGEVCADYSFYNRFFPTVEVGYEKSDKWSDNQSIHYQAAAPYGRIGVDYNLFYKKKHGHQLRIGARYGFSSFKYDIDANGLNENGNPVNPEIKDPIWEEELIYNHHDMQARMQWLEFGISVRGKLTKHLYMGWGLRFKYELSTKKDTFGDPWYVPGYGRYKSNVIGISYVISYKF